MSIFGAMQSGISALASQSSSMGAISDNIANVNTVGYKSNSVAFSTLVTKQSSSSLYSPGGVQSKPKQSISAQGLLSATSNSTDVAISGSGYFVVNQSANPGEGDLWAYCAGYVDHVIAGGQHGDEAHGGAGVDGPAGDGGLVGEDHLRTADPGDDLVLIGEAGAVVNRQVSQLLQFSPAEIAGVFRVSVQNDDVHFIPPVCVSPGPQGPGDSRFHWKVSRIAAVPAGRRT